MSSTPVIKRSRSAIGITADGQLVLAVNPDSNSLSVISTAAQQKVAEIPVTERDRAHLTQVVCVD
ncbi:MAG: hypothetical protein ACE5I2_08440 [Anaerolineae bacterium]